MAIRTVLFDMGNVLVSFSHERMFAQLGEVCGRTSEEVKQFLATTALANRFETGKVNANGFHAEIEQWVKRPVDQANLLRAGADIFWLDTPMPDVLKQIKSQGIRLVLLSNTSSTHIEIVREQWSFLDEFDELVLSYEVGAMKPDAAIYRAALAKIKCDPSECFYTDDVAPYVEAGRSFGLQAEIFRDVPSLSHHLAERGIKVVV
ncbi:HAD family phosphatase [bacterium]|nr:HAD family phosphatase [bacterium]